jgi:hypothetical protein
MKVSTEIDNNFGYEIEVKYLPNGTNAGYM